jgi:hypothetical protein
MDRWFARPRRVVAHAPMSVTSVQQRDETRRELLAIAVRDTLRKNGIPASWFATEMVSAMTSGRERGVQLRLVLREWQPQVLAYGVALQRAIEGKLRRMDPLSPAWLAGITWKFEPADDRLCPPLPHVGFWQQPANAPAVEASNDARKGGEQPARPVEPMLPRATPAVDFVPTQPMALR